MHFDQPSPAPISSALWSEATCELAETEYAPDRLKQIELSEDYTSRLAMLEELKTLPFGAVWDYYCLNADVPVGMTWLKLIESYEKDVLSKRE